METKITAAIKAEFTGTMANLEEDRREYRRRLALKEETLDTLEYVEAEVRRLHSERITLKERFWEAYYGDAEVPFSEVEAEPRALGRAIEKAEKALRKARADFENADFDEVAEGSALKQKAAAAQGEVERRIAELEETLGEVFAEVRRDVEKANRAVREELDELGEIEVARPSGAKEQDAREEDPKPHPRAHEEATEATMRPRTTPPTRQPRRPWWLEWLRRG